MDRVNLNMLGSKIKCANDGKRIEHDHGNNAADSNKIWVYRKRLQLCPDKLLLHLDNSLLYDVLGVCKFLAQKSILVLHQPL